MIDVRTAVNAQCAAVLRTPAPLVHAVLDALRARARLTAAEPGAALDPLLGLTLQSLEQAVAAAFLPGVAPGAGSACHWPAVEAAAGRALTFFSSAHACAPALEFGTPLKLARGLSQLAARMGGDATLAATAAASLAHEDLSGGNLAFALFTALHAGAVLYELEFDGIATEVAASMLRVDLMESKTSALKGAPRHVACFGC